MKFLFDFFPLILFFGMYKWGVGSPEAAQALANQYLSGLVSGGVVPKDQAALMLATLVAIVGTFGQILYLLIRRRKVDGMLWLSLVVVAVFGGAGIFFHDEVFIKWKPTILYWCFSLALAVGAVFFKKNGIRVVLETQVKLPDPIWKGLLTAWILFYTAMGFINLLVAFVIFKNDLNAWVNFKFYGATGLLLAFIVGQTIVLAKYMQEDTNEQP
jgi:intracellular septation protein